MILKKKMLGASYGLIVASVAMFSMTGTANATNESATISLKMDPTQGGLFKEVFQPVDWQVASTIDTADPTIQPMKEANLSHPRGALTFNPNPKMPVCPDDKIGPPPTNLSITVPEAIERCPDSIIGNGFATFALAQQTSLPRDGLILVFNGGLEPSGPLKGRPTVKTYSYSYDTGVGVYSEATLEVDGSLDFAIPQLTADSSVTSLATSIPGEPYSLYVASQNITVDVPAGQDPNFARARCATGTWDYSTEFLLGDRDTLGNPTSPTTTLNESASVGCAGATGKGKFANLKIKGPASVKKGKKGTYKVTVKNTGTATAKSVKLAASGKGVSGKASGGNIAPGKSKTIKVKVKFVKKGKVKTTFKVTGKQARAKTGKKTVKV